MKIACFLFFLLVSLSAHSQGLDSVLQEKTFKADSLLKAKASKRDSLSFSLKGRLTNSLNTDSVPLLSNMDSIRYKAKHRLDSAKSLNLPTGTITKRIDSLNQRSPLRYADSLNYKIGNAQNNINQPLKEAENSINQKLTTPVNGVENKINDKLNFVKKETGSSAGLPDQANAGVGDLKLPSSSSTSLPQLDTNLSDGNDLALPTINDKELNTSGAQKGLPEMTMPEGLESIEKAGGKLNEVSELTEKAGAVQTDVAGIKENGLSQSKEIPKLAEEKIAEVGGVDEIKKQADKMGLPQNGMMSEEDAKGMLKEQVKEESMKLARDHFAGKQDVLMGAMQKMTNLKTKYESLDSINVSKLKKNIMKGKPFRERIVVGLTLQIQRSQHFLIDYNPSLSYRITGRWNVGLGWNERLAFDNWVHVVAVERIFGPRLFTELNIRKGFSLRVEEERMWTSISSFSPPTSKEESRQGVWSTFAGIKKEYRIANHVKGTFQILYLMYDDHHNSPYAEKLNIRLGVEIPFRKKVK